MAIQLNIVFLYSLYQQTCCILSKERFLFSFHSEYQRKGCICPHVWLRPSFACGQRPEVMVANSFCSLNTVSSISISYDLVRFLLSVAINNFSRPRMCNLYIILLEYQGLYKLSLIFLATIIKRANVMQLTKKDYRLKTAFCMYLYNIK
jgi:hypothetical protein